MYVRKAVWVAQTLQQLDVDVATVNMSSPLPDFYVDVDVAGDGDGLVTGSSANRTWILRPHLATVRILSPDFHN